MKRSAFGNRSKARTASDKTPARKDSPRKTSSFKTPSAKSGERNAPDHKAAAQKAAVRALEKAKRIAARTGVKLSEWEDEFLGSVATRVKTFGRAFADPEKGDPRAPLSMMQAVKLKEITAKAKGGAPQGGQPPFRPRFTKKIAAILSFR